MAIYDSASETLKAIASGALNNSFVHEDGMTFEQAMAQMRAGKKVTRPKYREHIRFSIGVNEMGVHHFPCLLKHVKVSGRDQVVRWRAYIVSHVSVRDLLAEDWEVCDA